MPLNLPQQKVAHSVYLEKSVREATGELIRNMNFDVYIQRDRQRPLGPGERLHNGIL
jgi:hypothetical protein